MPAEALDSPLARVILLSHLRIGQLTDYRRSWICYTGIRGQRPSALDDRQPIRIRDRNEGEKE